MAARLSDLTPYYAEDGIRIYFQDSTKFAEEIAKMNALVITDPPYGVAERTMRKSAGRSCLAECNDFPPVAGDDRPFEPGPWLECPRIVLWGANHYSSRLPDSSAWLTWDKRVDLPTNDNADAELAWTNLGGPARLFRHRWMGMIRDSEQTEERSHPTQKPVALIRWIIEMHARSGELIVDPYMGSGATLLAAKAMGHPAIGFELEESYCKTAVERLKMGVQTEMFGHLFPKEKDCPHCGRRMRVLVNVTFNRKSKSADRLQPWCRECDSRNKRNKENGWKNFRRMLVSRKHGEEALWTEETYNGLLKETNWTCVYSGTQVNLWSGGYWVDKVDPERGYTPDNCKPCCWPCNRRKSNRHEYVYREELKPFVERHGWGKIPWRTIDPVFQPTDLVVPDLSPYVVDSCEVQLSLLDGRSAAE